LNNYKAKGKQFRRTDLEGIQGKLMGISKTLNNRTLDVCMLQESCKFNSSKMTHFI
jgi:hypothetical protein